MGGRAGIWEAVTFPVLSLGGSLLPTLPLDLVGVCVWVGHFQGGMSQEEDGSRPPIRMRGTPVGTGLEPPASQAV